MNRTNGTTVVLALLAVVVVGVAAATISTPISQPGSGASGPASSDGGGDQREGGDDERLVPEISFDFDYSPGAGLQNSSEDESTSGEDSGTEGGGSALNPQSPTGMAALVGVVVLVGLAVLVRARGEDDRETDDDSDTESEAVAGVRRAAGQAATRIETDAHADPDNEVYRAWREMTQHLDVAKPRTSTPGEFATTAVEAGMDPEDVSDLTAVFTEVRYGGRTPTAERERRAVETLRRIEGRDRTGDSNPRSESDRKDDSHDADEEESQ